MIKHYEHAWELLRAAWIASIVLISASCASSAAEFRGQIVDSATRMPLPARIYLQNDKGEWLFVSSAVPEGTAWPYREQWVPMPGSVELHTTVSAHPFHAELPAGEYTLEVERGKEYKPVREQFVIGDEPVEMTIRLTRWIDLASRGWYSGETHVHRRISELPQVMLAEDLNVAFPVTFWTTQSDQPPGLAPSPLRSQGPSPFGPREDRGTTPMRIDETHVILPRNTEYEIFSVGGRRHTLGAIFLLNHRSVFTSTAPPIGPIAEQARREGALLDLDKHSWPWSMMLVPVAKVDLFELSNNSVWRTRFGFNRLAAPLPPWIRVEMDSADTVTEWGWLNYGFEVYYALLNCGFRLAPTAGTASGVHPVPLGHSRVYVHTGDRFELEAWLAGLKAGRSFVTTGPMLLVTVEGKLAGESFEFAGDEPREVTVDIESVSEKPVTQIEILVNGQVVEALTPALTKTAAGAWQAKVRPGVKLTKTSWLAVRSIEPQPAGRKRFAHTAPWHFSIGGRPLTPRREQVEYFVSLMEGEIKRNRDVLQTEALAEFEQALEVYRQLLSQAE